MSEAPGSTNAMKVGFGVLGEVKVDHNVDGLNVDTTSKEIGADEIAADPTPEVVEDSVAVCLKHASMAIKARIAEFGNLLGQKFNTIS